MFERRSIGHSTRERQSSAFAWPEQMLYFWLVRGFFREGYRLTERALSLRGRCLRRFGQRVSSLPDG